MAIQSVVRQLPARQRVRRALLLISLLLFPITLYYFSPVMYQHLGESILEIGGIAVTVPDSPAAMRELIRSDINRYATVLLPFAVLGLRDLLERLWAWARSRAARRRISARSTRG
jgi:hypothetical protein